VTERNPIVDIDVQRSVAAIWPSVVHGFFDESFPIRVPWGRAGKGLWNPDNFTPVWPRCQAKL